MNGGKVMPKKNRYFYDCEFLEDGKTIELISIGIVCDDGREFYAEQAHPFRTLMEIQKSQWLVENVVPSLKTIGISKVTGTLYQDIDGWFYPNEIRDQLLEFTKGTWPEFWAWYGAYDHVALCQLFGRMVDLPKHFPMFTRDIRQLWEAKGRPKLPEQEVGKHNALEDARHNKVMYDFLEPF